ncbi:type II toxin-antitoxin system VapC family toxin [Agromyces neolithicus]|uniref:Ribonuclease VapC n=1 Tax=Agromyces neolithicus TaxID=269420 RepID=A0ABP4Y5J1_9MICO
MPTVADTVGAVVVIDASAIVTLLIDPGEHGESVAERLAHSTLIAPTLLPFEVANVLRRRRNSGLLSPAEAQLAHDELLRLPIELWPWEPPAQRSWQLGPNLSSYDAAYVALAELVGAPLVTRDSRLASAPGPRCPVELV